MPRPKGRADLMLMEAGRALLEEGGLSALTVRGVARKAKVNLGLFHYHYGSREDFAKVLLQQCYEDFFSRLSPTSLGGGSPLERLRRALMGMARHARENRRLLMALVQDAMRGDKLVIAHAKANFPRHIAVLTGLIQECQNSGLIRKVPFPTLMPFLMGGLNLPNLAFTILERVGAKRPFGMSLDQLENTWLSDEGLELRLDLLLSALTPASKRS